MILASCTENNPGPDAKGVPAVISYTEGGIPFALYSSSFVSVFHIVSSSTRSSLRTVSALRAYIPLTAPSEGTSCTLQGLISWKDILHSLEMQRAPPGSREVSNIRKTVTAHPAHLLFRQLLLSVMGRLIFPHPKTNALNGPIRVPSCTPFKSAEERSIPEIVITAPLGVPSHQASCNTVPTPQDAAFGNQLTVPDPEFTVINCRKSPEEYYYMETFTMYENGLVPDDPFAGFGGCPSPSWGDPEEGYDTIVCASGEDREEDDVNPLGLGPTWSG